ncbi:hypothetical protein L1887_59464 [Cichorium endivia]|nr:hypothetical protein L1887_59464 [Cichorium endivia]
MVTGAVGEQAAHVATGAAVGGGARRTEAEVGGVAALTTRGIEGGGAVADGAGAVVGHVVGLAGGGTDAGSADIVAEVGETTLEAELSLVREVGAEVGGGGRVGSGTRMLLDGLLRVSGVGGGFSILAETGEADGTGSKHVACLAGSVEVELLLEMALQIVGGAEIAMIVVAIHGGQGAERSYGRRVGSNAETVAARCEKGGSAS